MSTVQPTWSEIDEGMSIPELVKVPTPMQLFMFSAVTWNRHLIHYNTEFAVSDGLKNVAVHRALIGGFLAQMLSKWLGDAGRIQAIEWSVRGSASIGKPLTLKGVVKGKRQEEAKQLLDCEIWAEDHEGTTIVPGSAVVELDA
jgi:hydroxyacyl-ACP dehydratase HTD2-like protein with hotdog domain